MEASATLFLKSALTELNEGRAEDSGAALQRLLGEARVFLRCFDPVEEASAAAAAEAKAQLKKWAHAVVELASSDRPLSRFAGLELLRTTLAQCNYEHFLANHKQWEEALLHTLRRSDESAPVLQAAYLATAQFVRTSLKWADVRRELLKETLPKFLSALVRALDVNDSVVKVEALVALNTALQEAPASLRAQVPQIRPKLFTLLDHNDPKLRKMAALSIALLPSKPLEWEDLYRACATRLHSLTVIAYKGLIAGQSDQAEYFKDITLPAKISTWPSASAVVRELDGVVQTLRSLLAMPTLPDEPASLPLESTLHLLVKVFAVDSSKLTPSASEGGFYSVADLAVIIPALHAAAFDILHTLLISCKSILFPYMKLILEMVLLGLNRGQQNSLFALSGASLRVRQYASASECLRIFGPSALLFNASDLVAHALSDLKGARIASVTDGSEVILGESRDDKKHRKKRQRSEQLSVGKDEAALTAPEDSLTHVALTTLPVAVAAFQFLASVMSNGGSALKLEDRSNIDKVILGFTFELESNTFLSPTSRPTGITGDPSFASATLSALLASVQCPLIGQPAITAYAIRTFSALQNNSNPSVSDLARRGLSACALAMHPRAPMSFLARVPVAIQKDHAQKLSVQHLDYVPPVIVPTDATRAQEEPAAKKIRVDAPSSMSFAFPPSSSSTSNPSFPSHSASSSSSMHFPSTPVPPAVSVSTPGPSVAPKKASEDDAMDIDEPPKPSYASHAPQVQLKPQEVSLSIKKNEAQTRLPNFAPTSALYDDIDLPEIDDALSDEDE